MPLEVSLLRFQGVCSDSRKPLPAYLRGDTRVRSHPSCDGASDTRANANPGLAPAATNDAVFAEADPATGATLLIEARACHIAGPAEDTSNTVASGGAASASGSSDMTFATSGSAS